MLGFKAIRTKRQHLLGRALLVAAAAVFAPVLAHAHFVLVAPDAWMSQDVYGLPEKVGPCGDEGGGKPTGKVTVFRPGQTIDVTINEVIHHPGHYRVALAVNDRSELPQEPLVTPSRTDPCASAAIQNPPIFPILADNVLPHTQVFGAPQTFAVTLPTNVTCTKCTLQVLEFMSSHGAPCFYHHCADISIQAAPETASPTPSPTATCTPTETPTSTQVAAPTETPTPSSTPTPPQSPGGCAGDCGGTQTVATSDLITLVSIALGNAHASACPYGVPSGDAVDITMIIQAVNHAPGGCGG